jgi:hypothetical protein
MDDTLQKILEYPLLRSTHKRKREEIFKVFPELKNCEHDKFLILNKYLCESPQRFYLKSVYQLFFDSLEKRDQCMREALKEYFIYHENELNRAFLHLEEINKFNWHDELNNDKDYELLRFIDQRIHPTYLRMIESVLYPILSIAAYFSRIDKGSGTEGLNIFQIIEELKKTDLNELTKPYSHIMRNGIAHGGIIYLQDEIRYKDSKGNEDKKDGYEIIRIFDDLVDTCNALIAALSVFLLTHQVYGYKLPQQFLINELSEETKNPWWEILGCLPSELTKINQLIVFSRSRTIFFDKIQFFAIQSCLLAGMLAPGYDRYFLSIRSQMSTLGCVSFDGKKLKQVREKPGSSLIDYFGAIENNLIFKKRYKWLKLLERISTLFVSFNLNWIVFKVNIKRQFGIPRISIRLSNIHRNSWGLVLNSTIFIENPNGEITKDYIKRWCRKIVRKSLRHARSQCSIIKFFKYLPLGYADISIYKKDYRRRRLADFGLESDLVCTIKIKKIKRIRMPDIYKSVVESFGKYHFAWNRSWLEITYHDKK